MKYEIYIYTSHESVLSLGQSAEPLLGGQDGETDLLEEVQYIYICCSIELLYSVQYIYICCSIELLYKVQLFIIMLFWSLSLALSLSPSQKPVVVIKAEQLEEELTGCIMGERHQELPASDSTYQTWTKTRPVPLTRPVPD